MLLQSYTVHRLSQCPIHWPQHGQGAIHKSSNKTYATLLKKKITKSKHIKGSKERYLSGQNTTCEFSGWSPLWSYKRTLKQQLNSEIRDVGLRHLSAFGWAVWFSCGVLGKMLARQWYITKQDKVGGFVRKNWTIAPLRVNTLMFQPS